MKAFEDLAMVFPCWASRGPNWILQPPEFCRGLFLGAIYETGDQNGSFCSRISFGAQRLWGGQRMRGFSLYNSKQTTLGARMRSFV